MRELHVSAEVLDRFARGDLDDARLSDVLDHLETCEECARAGQDHVAADLSTLRTGWAASHESHQSHQSHQSHGTDRTDGTNTTYRTWMLAAAAVIAIVALSLTLLPRDRPAPHRPTGAVVVAPPERPSPPATTETRTVPQPRYANPEWERVVTRALESGRLPFPGELAELRAPADTVRGAGGVEERIAPTGVVVEETRPTFTWPAREGGLYTVFIFDGDRKVMESTRLQRPRWTPDRDLPRGRTLTWQVEVTGLAAFETIPSPPSPPALFRVIDEKSHRELVEARERHGDDPLLLAVLHARGGMRAEALAELRRAAAGDAAAKRILEYETSRRR